MTPTATARSRPAATANASSNGCPARVRPPATLYESQYGSPVSSATRTTASASSMSGTVSSASTSGPASANAAIRGRWNRSSSRTVSPYRPRYSLPSASIAPYGPTEAATQTSRPGSARREAPAARRASSTLRASSARARSGPIPRCANPSNVAW